MAASGSGGYGGPNFAKIEGDLRNIAIQFGSIVALTNQIKASIDTFRLFERELTLANFAAGGTVQTFNQMEKAARNMALGSTNSVAQLANAFGNLARAGLDAKEVLAAATGVMLLANATLSDLGEAADITASTIAQFNLRADESYRIANLFVAASNNSLASMNKLAFAMRQVGPIAAQANLSLEQTVGMLDKLFDAGLRGEQAGTALRNTIARLVDPMGAGKDVLENLGVSALDAKGEVDIDAALRKLAGMNLSLRDVSEIAGVEAAAGMLTLLASIRDTNDGLDVHIAKISGTQDAYGQAMVQMATLDGSLQQASNAFNELRLIAGESMAPVIIDLAQGFVDLVLNIREMNSGIITTALQMGLATLGVAALLRGVAAIPAAFASGARSVRLLGEGVTAATNSMQAMRQGLSTVPIGIQAAGHAVRNITTAMMGFIGVTAGILGVAAALAGVTFAMLELQKAKDKAKLDELIGETNLNPAEARRSLRNTNLQFNVDEGSGAGAIQKYNALMEQAKGAAGQADEAQKQLLELHIEEAARGERIVEQIRSLNALSTKLNSELLSEINAGGTELQSATAALGSATADKWPAAVEAMKAAYIARIRASDRSDAAKAEMIAAAQVPFAKLTAVDAEVRVKLQADIRAQQSSGKDFEIVAGLGGTQSASALAKVFDIAENEYVINARQLEKRTEELTTAQGEFLQVSEKARTDANNQLDAVKTEIDTFVKVAYGSSTELGNTTADSIDRWIEKNPQRFLEIIRAAGNDTVRVIQMIAKEGDIAVTKIQGAMDALATGTVPRINKEAIDDYWAKALKASVEGATGIVEASVLSAARDATRVAGNNSWRREATTLLAGALSEREGGAIAPAIIAGIEAGTIKNIDDAAVAVRNGGGALTVDTAPAVGRVVEAARRLYEDNAREALTLGAKTGGGGGGRRGGMSPSQRTIDKLLDLPTESEFKLDAERMASEIRNTLATYLGFELDAYSLAMEEAELDYREDQLDFQRDFEKFWRDNIAKGLDIALDQGAINAISGRGFKLNGREFTPDMLREEGTGAEYMSGLLEYLTPKIPANAPQYQARVDAVKRVVEELGTRSAGMWSMLQEQFKVIDIERQRVDEAAREASQGFDLEAATMMLQSQLDAITVTDPLNMNLRAAVSFDLELANIRQSGQSQINALQDQFKAEFDNIGVAVLDVGDAFEIMTTQSSRVGEVELTRANQLVEAYNRVRDAIRAGTEAKIFDAEAGVNGIERQRESWEAYADALEKVANANGNNADVMDDFLMGMQAGFSRFLADIPTSFEVGMAGMQEAVNGFASVSTDLVLGMGDDWRASVANILQSIAQMIMKMLIMAATLQMIRMIPGGTALLAAMDAGASIVSAGSAGVAAGTAVNTAGGGGRTTVNAYGGVHDHDQMMRGGVKRPGDTSMAIFGEGQWPEAFIPMVDGASIPVSMGADGRFFVQLPSGQKVPVSMKGVSQKKHAYGGVSGNVTPSFDMRSMADGASMAGREATGYAGGGRRSAETSGGASTYNFYGGDVIIQGNADGNTAEEIGKQQAQAFGAMLTSHETEKDKQRLRREGRTGFSAKGTI